MAKPEDFETVIYEIPHKARVEFEWIGEGLNGDYDADDPDDVPVLRFTATDLAADVPDEHPSRSAQDNSFATMMPATLPRAVVESVAKFLAHELADLPRWKILEERSWLDGKAARKIHAAKKGRK